ncbi:HIT-like domain-containing protein [Leucosporidium creatinivorum]|uniref:HIT-like domain-containing protein n=1 Tax=Leucosporidium creatinivorum TaxID=106004 RepID=A0A1Y2FZS2_9BASI|nr:HIT-like domain-containing protein [Leucosporidium creatinivorum]
MTSHFINYFARRAQSVAHLSSPAAAPGREQEFNGASENKGKAVEGCTFCDILAGEIPAFKVYEDEHVLAFLDIFAIREGHLLVIPRQHYARVSHLPDDVSAGIGRALPRIARALCRAVDQPDFNIISNDTPKSFIMSTTTSSLPHISTARATRPLGADGQASSAERSWMRRRGRCLLRGLGRRWRGRRGGR